MFYDIIQYLHLYNYHKINYCEKSENDEKIMTAFIRKYSLLGLSLGGRRVQSGHTSAPAPGLGCTGGASARFWLVLL